MALSKMGCPMRLVFVFMSVLIWLGIFLTGFGNVHWVLYLPAIGSAVAGISGICMGATIMGRFCKS